MWRLWRYWVAALSVISSLITLAYGLTERGPVERWVWIVIAYLALAFAFSLVWWEEHRSAKIGRALHGTLKSRYDDLVLAWTALDNLFQNSVGKQEHSPKTLPMPMASKQIGDLDFRYRIGCLQAQTFCLLDDFRKVGIDIGYAKEDIRSVPELLRVLERSKL